MIEPFKAKTLTRLKKVRGQIDGIIRMIEEDKYCINVNTQLLAAQGSLKAVAPLVLESHLNSCSANALTSKDKKKKEDFIKELIKAFTLANR